MAFIDNWKNKGLKHDQGKKLEKQCNLRVYQNLKVYAIYSRNTTRDLNAMDFGDLLLFTSKLSGKQILKI